MTKLSQKLLVRCRNVLLRCHEFESYRTLRVLFITDELCAFRFGLPRADNTSDLVDYCLEYLHDQHLTDGRPVLPIFLDMLRRRYEDSDGLRDELEALYQDVESAMSQCEGRHPRGPYHRQELFDSLLKIDFGEQVRLVKQTLRLHRAASFLVHGKPKCGQQILVNRLLRLAPNWQSGRRISINVASPAIGQSINSLWRHIARELDVDPGTSSDELAQKVCEWWQTQDVIFIFHTVDYMLPDYFSRWIEDFWQPIVAAAHNSLHRTQRDTRLMMFLVDYSGSVCEWNVTLAYRPEEPEYPLIPLHLPPADRFPPEFLSVWIDMMAEVLPADLTAQTIMEASENGVPRVVYQAICDHCGLSWEGEMTKWLV